MKHIITSALYLAVLLLLSVFVFDKTNLYYELPWLDIPMHVLGGFGVASLALSVQAYRNKKASFFIISAAYICVAVGWELYEFVKDVMNISPWNGWSDTISDLVNGAIGATCSYYLLKK